MNEYLPGYFPGLFPKVPAFPVSPGSRQNPASVPAHCCPHALRYSALSGPRYHPDGCRHYFYSLQTHPLPDAHDLTGPVPLPDVSWFPYVCSVLVCCHCRFHGSRLRKPPGRLRFSHAFPLFEQSVIPSPLSFSRNIQPTALHTPHKSEIRRQFVSLDPFH